MAANASPAPDLDVELLQQAAEWYATLRADDVSPDDRQRWTIWLSEHPAHAAAWQRIESVSRRFVSLREEERAQATLAGARAARRALATRRNVLRSIVGLAGAGFAGCMALRYTPLREFVIAWDAQYRTSIGEQREIQLADGTRAWLNTASAMDVAYGDAARTITLRAGELFVDTAKDPARRPFYVETAFGRVEALGTRFGVWQDDERVRVGVFEGLVEVRNAAGAMRRVPAGQRVHFDARAISAPEAADSARQAWTHGVLMADNITLRQFVDELSRYTHDHIGVAPEVADIRIIGVYPANDTDRALSIIADEFPVRVRRPLPWWVTLDRGA